jgi:hypothetical protein
MLRHHAMLFARCAIGLFEGFAQVGSGIQIGCGTPRIPFVEGVGR